MRLAHVNRAGPGAPGHVTDTGETGWSHGPGLVASTHVLEARERGLGPRRARIGPLPPRPKAQGSIAWVGRVGQEPCYQHVPPLLPLPHRVLATSFAPGLPVWLPPLSSRDTLPSGDRSGPGAQYRQKRCRMRAKLPRCHLVVPASGAERSLWCREVSLHLLFCRDGVSMEVPGSGARRVAGCLSPPWDHSETSRLSNALCGT